MNINFCLKLNLKICYLKEKKKINKKWRNWMKKTQNFVRKGLVYEYSGSAKIFNQSILIMFKKIFQSSQS